MYEDSWTTDIDKWIEDFKEMVKDRKNLILIRGGANFYHYDKSVKMDD